MKKLFFNKIKVICSFCVHRAEKADVLKSCSILYETIGDRMRVVINKSGIHYEVSDKKGN